MWLSNRDRPHPRQVRRPPRQVLCHQVAIGVDFLISEYIVCISDSQKCVNTLKKEMGMIDRDIHLKRLIALKHNGMIKIVTGIRRCGKSTLLFKLFAEHLKQSGVDEKHIVKVDLEDRRNKSLRDPDELMAYIDSMIKKDGDMHYVLIDEV